jgi:GntR family transcriptional regulator
MYYQLKELLREKIAAGEWQPGTMIPSERELSEEYSISRMTVRQALTELSTEGILRRVQGKGTFVAQPKIQQGLTRLTGFTEDMRTRGSKAGGQVLRLELETPSTLALAALQITPTQPVVLLERLRLAQSEPIALETCHLHFSNVEKLLLEDFANNSLYNLLTEKYGITPTRAEQQVEADLCSQREQKLLRLSEKSPVLRNRRVTFDQWGRPFEYTESAYRADRYVLQADLSAS